MTVFYTSHNLEIDNRAYMTPGGTYLLDDLTQVEVVRGKPDQLPRTGANAAAAALVLAAATGPLLDSPAGYAIGALTFLVAAGTGGFSLLNRRPRWELHAVHRGREVCLLSTTDERTFGQIRRGLLRAYEARERA